MEKTLIRILRGILLTPLLGALLGGCSSPYKSPTPMIAPTAGQSLRAYAFQRGVLIGSAAAPAHLSQDNLYAQTLVREFSMLTPEDAMKFLIIHPEKNTYDFSDADATMQFAEQNGLQVRGHVLVWHSQLSPWVSDGNFTRAELIAILKDHILTVAGRYRGKVAAWDVVNEAIDDNGSLRDTIFLRTIGPEYIDMAFKWAHQADPQARLFYNDYNTEDMGTKSNAVYALVQGLIKRGVPIQGVGLQMHIILDTPPRPEEVAANIKRLADLGMEVQITEMDVRIEGAATDDKLAAQAKVYHDEVQACLSVKNCNAIVLWGITDRYSWVPQFFPGFGAPLLFDDLYNPKPAYQAVVDALQGK